MPRKFRKNDTTPWLIHWPHLDSMDEVPADLQQLAMATAAQASANALQLDTENKELREEVLHLADENERLRQLARFVWDDNQMFKEEKKRLHAYTKTRIDHLRQVNVEAMGRLGKAVDRLGKAREANHQLLKLIKKLCVALGMPEDEYLEMMMSHSVEKNDANCD